MSGDRKVVAIFDGPNIYACQSSLGQSVDFAKVKPFLMDRFDTDFVRLMYYTATKANAEFDTLRPLLDYLDFNGYELVTKDAREFTDNDGNKKIKGNMEVEMAVDAMHFLTQGYDHYVLFSGDGDFAYLVKQLQRSGARVTVVSSLRSKPPMVADALRRAADEFLDLNDLGLWREKNGRGRTPATEYDDEDETGD